MCTNLALQRERCRVRECLFSPQLASQILGRFQDRIALQCRPSDWHYRLVEVFWRILDWCQRCRIVVDSGIDQDRPVSGISFWGGRKVIYPASLDIDGGNLGVVVFCQNGEFDSPAPS